MFLKYKNSSQLLIESGFLDVVNSYRVENVNLGGIGGPKRPKSYQRS